MYSTKLLIVKSVFFFTSHINFELLKVSVASFRKHSFYVSLNSQIKPSVFKTYNDSERFFLNYANMFVS